ncbi:mevalonate kinase isoform X1 [Vigna unguiculata]|uniref:mevalonate kinase isoform X1 n=1 Tax=Vigna unguiculata TaxID=3917 RepID=UPI001015D49A|nr:mevalonate kinase isoform X1 [Vigna unguiculata]XP_027931998.1 mevalonate kinase isoform X1 [Vigna unguiculata]XP_027931999.1 mevalonate kinase isoform X1 [Vigna unguiculata]
MEVRARAPGKIILTGEHAVVHGSTAVATSIDLYTYVSVHFATPSDDGDLLKLQLKDTALEFSWPISRIKTAFPESVLSCTPTSCSVEVAKSIAALVEELDIPEAKIGIASGVSAFLWLYSSIQGVKPSTVVVTSELPLGSGLGSSAAFCVALASALLAYTDSVSLDLSHKGWLSFTEKDLELVNKWAFEGEKIIHGKPSGIDNTVSAYGNIISFKSGNITRTKSTVTLKMLITNTKVGRNTKALVAGVGERMLRHPEIMAFVFSAVDSISKELTSILKSPTPDELSLTEKEEKIEELMEMNQGLLQSMGVSHATIETVLRTTLKYKLASKLTGAGGGGCVLTLLPTLLSGTIVDKVISELESCGFQCFIAGIGGGGVEVNFVMSS